jgi:hypothetical protein
MAPRLRLKKVIAADSLYPQVDIKVTLTAIYYNNNRSQPLNFYLKKLTLLLYIVPPQDGYIISDKEPAT